MAKLQRDFYNRPTLDVARDLLGKYLVRELGGEKLVCRITETEGYIGRIDKACHAYGWGTRTRPASDLKASRPSALSSLPGGSPAASSAFWDVNLSKPEILRSFEGSGHIAGAADEAVLPAQGGEVNHTGGGAGPSKPGWVRVPQPCGYKRTKRTETLFAPPGTAYIYLIYGMYDCLNFVTEAEGEPCAVLIRALEARHNGDRIARNRYGCAMAEMNAYQRKNFLNGPGKLCKGLALTRAENGLDLTGDALYVADSLSGLGLPPCPGDDEPFDIQAGRRVGIDYAEEAAEFPWRFWI